jgi:hypothetical protein
VRACVRARFRVFARYKMELHFLIYVCFPVIMLNSRDNFSCWLTGLLISRGLQVAAEITV